MTEATAKNQEVSKKEVKTETTIKTIGNIIDVGDFVTVTDNSFAENGVPEDTVVYVAGDAVVNVDEEDPYLLRRIFLVAFVEDGHIIADKGAFTIDGKRLKKVSDKKQKELDFLKNQDFGLDEDKNEATH